MTVKSARAGFTLVEIMVVIAIIILLAAIAVPNFVQARKQLFKDSCMDNLKQIQVAKERWALDKNKDDSAVATFADLSVYLDPREFNEGVPRRPKGATYTIHPVGQNPTCTDGSRLISI